MSIKGLPIIKCIKCGKTIVLDEYHLYGCTCGSKDMGIDFKSYRRRECLSELGDGFHDFVGKFIKVGNLHYNNTKWYALVENLACGTTPFATNHIYIPHLTPSTVDLLKATSPGTKITFKARVNNYDKQLHKWGLDQMHSVVPLH